MSDMIIDLYPSRKGSSKLNIIERKDPVIYANGENRSKLSLTGEQLEFFENHGFIIIENVFSNEYIDSLYEEVNKLKVDKNLENRDEKITEPESNEVRSIFSPHKFSEKFDKLSKNSKILDKVMQILNSDVCIHHSRINIKPALKGKSFQWHSDFETWHTEDGVPNMRILSCNVFLTDNNEHNGPLYVIPGSHKHYLSFPGETPEQNYKSSLRKQEYGSPDIESLKYLIDKGKRGIKSVIGKKGSIVLFDGNLMHGSPDNISPWSRTNFFIVYNSIENKAGKPFSGKKPRPEFLCDRKFERLIPEE